MKKRALAVILLATVAVVGCGKVDEEITSKEPDKKETKVEEEVKTDDIRRSK